MLARYRPAASSELKQALLAWEFGTAQLVLSPKGVLALHLDPCARALESDPAEATLSESERQWVATTAAVLAGSTERLPPLDLRGTSFQRHVWELIAGIPAGATLGYRRLAEAALRPQAVRAVAQACAANPVAVLIPCHRVVRTDGGLGGYRWGIALKQALLARERAGVAPVIEKPEAAKLAGGVAPANLAAILCPSKTLG